MAENGTHSTGSAATFVTRIDTAKAQAQRNSEDPKRLKSLEIPLEHMKSPPSPAVEIAPIFRKQTSLDVDDYFTGPRDVRKHSKWPLFMQMHGSILPKMVLPLFVVGAWATAITVISMKVHWLGVNSVLLTITGFVVGLGLSFRSSTAYERYAEGRRYWGMLVLASQNLGRVFWIHARDIEDQDPRELTLKKLSAMNLVVAFAISLKHTLRFEPYTAYPDLEHLVGHLNTFAKEATAAEPEMCEPKKKNSFKEVGEYLGVSFAASNPRKALKKNSHILGNLPLEILNHLAITLDRMVANDQLPIPMTQTLAFNNLSMLNDVLVGCERILNTPLPIAYGIAISQITWVYVMLLPFQLVKPLEWVAIPATIAAAYIILGLLLIGREIENPFGQDVNDLPLEIFCDQITTDLDIIASYDKREPDAFIMGNKNMPLYPVSTASSDVWMKRSDEKLRSTIMNKPKTVFEWRRSQAHRKAHMEAGEKCTPGDHNV
ncbi:Fc.00g107960.m01.CDS01 [Cosmosporella sp. VM-42]